MLQAIRDRATGWIAYGIVGLLVIPFAFWGINQYGGGGQLDVAVVAGEKISQIEFQRAYQNQQARMRAMLGGSLDPDTLESLGLKQQVLEQLIDQRVLTATSVDVGLQISDEALGRAIHEIPQFQSDGNFDPSLYRRLLASQGYTPETFEVQMRLDATIQQLQGGVAQSFAPTAADLDGLIKLREQRREIETLRLSRAAVREEIEIGDGELESWFQANRDQFQVPERVRLRYLELEAAKLGDEGLVTEDELRARYEEQKGRFLRPEERVASYVLLPLDSAAAEAATATAREQMTAVRARLESGELSFEQLREQAGAEGLPAVEVGSLGVVVPGMLDPGAEQALMALTAPGALSEVVRNDYGLQFLRLDELRPAEGRPYEEVKAELEAEIRRERGESRFYDLADELATLTYESPGSLDPAAEALGLTVQESDWISRDAAVGIWSDRELREAAFSADVLDQGLNSQALELSPTHVVVLRLLEHEPARRQELEEVRDAARQALRDQRTQELIADQASQVVAAVRAGKSPQAEAERTGAAWEGPRQVSRAESGLDPALREATFALPHPTEELPSVSEVQVAGGDRTVVVLHRVEDGDPGSLDAAGREALRAALAQEYGQGQFRALLTAIRGRTDIQVFQDRL